jgi:hypothetical protein
MIGTTVSHYKILERLGGSGSKVAPRRDPRCAALLARVGVPLADRRTPPR